MNTVVCAVCETRHDAGLARCPSCGTPAAAPEPRLPAGTKLRAGQYTVGRVLGRGGFGITYKGADTRLRRPVAVKELFPEFAVRRGPTVTVPAARQADFQRERASVVREAQALAGVRAPGVVGVHDFFEEHGTAYIVLEYLEGPTLEAEIERRGSLPSAEAVRVAVAVCEALAAVHGASLLHRDVKPANLLLAGDGRVVLLDFGAARAYEAGQTQSHTRLVTPAYAAPEQYSPEGRFGPATDLFGLGATLYHALTGAPPKPGMERLLAGGQAPAALPSSVSAGLRQAVEAALHCRVEDRPADAAAFRALLDGGRVPVAPAAGVSVPPPVRNTGVPAPAPAAAPGSGAQSNNGDTPLHVAARNGDDDLLSWLLSDSHLFDDGDLDERNAADETPLYLATVSGNQHTVKRLVRAGASVVGIGAQSNNGDTPLHVAARNGDDDLLSWLLSDSHLFDDGDLDERNAADETPLYLATVSGNQHTVKRLVRAGASVVGIGAQSNNGDTPLHVAARNGDDDLLSWLLSDSHLFDDGDLDERNAADETPLYLATVSGNQHTVKRLVRAGASVVG